MMHMRGAAEAAAFVAAAGFTAEPLWAVVASVGVPFMRDGYTEDIASQEAPGQCTR